MFSPQRVVWSEGMFIAPQHMQQLDRYHERLLHARMLAVSSLSWGVRRLKLDADALESSEVKVDVLEAILPEGDVLSVGGERDEHIPSRLIEGHFPPTERKLEVYVGLPREREGMPNYAADDGDRSPRYSRRDRSVADLTSGRTHVPVTFARRNPRILFGDEPREDLDCVKIAELLRDGAGALVTNERFIPPLVSLSASSWLLDGLKDILRLGISRQRELASARRQRDNSSVVFESTDVTRYLFQCALDSHIPVLKAMLPGDAATPRELYLELLRLGGHLSSFAASAEPPRFPVFNHNNLGATFHHLFNQVRELLSTVVRSRCLRLDFRRDEQGKFHTAIRDARMLECSRYVLGARCTGKDASQLAEELPRLAKLAATGDLDRIRAAAVGGVRIRPTQQLSGIPVRTDTVYFAIEAEGQWWINVIRERSLSISPPADYRNDGAEFELLGLLEQGGR